MRTRSMTTAIAAMTITGALSLSAQTPTTPPTSSGQRSGASQSSDQTVTVTGCIQQDTMSSTTGRSGSSGATGTTGASGTTGSGGTTGSTASGTTGASGTMSSSARGSNYVLTNVKMAQGSSTSGLGTATRVSLSGQDAELQKHLNHQVEVTGRLSATGSSMSGSGSTAGTTGSTASGTTGSGSTGTTGSTAGTTSGTTGSTGSGTTSGATGSRSGSSMGSSMSDLPQLQVSSIKMVSASCPAQQ